MLTGRKFNKRVQVLMDSNHKRIVTHGGKILRCISRKTLSQETEVFVYLFLFLMVLTTESRVFHTLGKYSTNESEGSFSISLCGQSTHNKLNQLTTFIFFSLDMLVESLKIIWKNRLQTQNMKTIPLSYRFNFSCLYG